MGWIRLASCEEAYVASCFIKGWVFPDRLVGRRSYLRTLLHEATEKNFAPNLPRAVTVLFPFPVPAFPSSRLANLLVVSSRVNCVRVIAD
jgi:hypothetical protein